MLHVLRQGIDNQCTQLPPPRVSACECRLGLCRVAVCRCTKRLNSDCRVLDNLCKAATNERNENLFSNCRVQDSLCKVDTNECNENLFSNCRVQDNLCKVTTFFSLFRVTFCLCCFFSTVCFRFLLLKAVCRLQHDSVLYATRHWWTSLLFRCFEQWLKSVCLAFNGQTNLLLPSNKHLLTNAQDICLQKVFFMRLRYVWHIFNDKTQASCKQLIINGTLFLKLPFCTS